MKKVVKIVGIVLGIIVLLSIIFFVIDNNRVSKQLTPIFCIQNPRGVIEDGGTIEYLGLGYKVIDFHTISGFDDIKIGTWFMQYEDFSSEIREYEMKMEEDNKKNYSKTIDGITIELNVPNEWNYEEIEVSEKDNFKFALNFYKSSKEKNATLYFYNNMFGVCGTGLTSEKITLNNGKEANIGYYGGNEKWSFISFDGFVAFINNGLDSSESKEVLDFAKTININNEQSESYPAQVKETKIEVKSAENFEILFYDKHPMKNDKIYTILGRSETDKYDYTIYGYDGSVNIRIDGKDYSLKEALLENKITMEEIIAKANKDFPNAVSYDDGGSMEYHYENYTIIKCHRLDGNRDVYIGTKEMTLNDVI